MNAAATSMTSMQQSQAQAAAAHHQSAVALGHHHSLEVGKKRAAENDMFQLVLRCIIAFACIIFLYILNIKENVLKENFKYLFNTFCFK